MELENHHFATIAIDSGKNLQWMLEPMGRSLLENKIIT